MPGGKRRKEKIFVPTDAFMFFWKKNPIKMYRGGGSNSRYIPLQKCLSPIRLKMNRKVYRHLQLHFSLLIFDTFLFYLTYLFVAKLVKKNTFFYVKLSLKSFVIEFKPKMLSVMDLTDRPTDGHSE